MSDVAPSINKDEVQRVFGAAPFIQDLGLTLQYIGAGECHTRLSVNERHLQQDGLVHAGVQATIADHTAGTAAAGLVAKDHQVLSVEFKINLLRAAKGRQLDCVARVLKTGSSLIVAESEVFCSSSDQDKQLVSKATVTLIVLKPRH